jgi:uncharacterized protein (TIGR02147 family)
MPDIYDYDSYRAFLAAWLEERKGRVSLRLFAKRLTCSAALISSVLAGDRDLNPYLVERACVVLELVQDERAYFRALVQSERGETPEERQRARQEVVFRRRFARGKELEDRELQVFAYWYVGAIHELIRCPGFKEDPEWIARTLRPAIRPEQAAAALETLLELGMVARGEDGRLATRDEVARTRHQSSSAALSFALRNQHGWVLDRAKEAIEQVPRPERYLGTLCMAVPERLVAGVMERCQTFLEEINAVSMGAESPRECVYQLSVQVIPLSHPVRAADDAPGG